MDAQIAAYLVGEFVRQCRIVPNINTRIFNDALLRTDVLESRLFHEQIPYTEQEIKDTHATYTLSLRRVLRNKHAAAPITGLARMTHNFLVRASGSHSSTVLARSIREDPTLRQLLSSCSYPYSLLGKLVTYDTDVDYCETREKQGEITTRPLLIIPDVTDRTAIEQWEIAHITTQ